MKTFITLTLITSIGLFFAVFTVEAQDGQKISRRDQLRAATQQICPVSGQQLGEHGTPVKVTVGKQKEEVFLCCQACLKGQLNADHWKTIHSNYAKAQAICPVMEHELPENPKWTIANGKIIYVCCPPCTKKIAAEKEKYLSKLDQLYAKSLKQK